MSEGGIHQKDKGMAIGHYIETETVVGDVDIESLMLVCLMHWLLSIETLSQRLRSDPFFAKVCKGSFGLLPSLQRGVGAVAANIVGLRGPIDCLSPGFTCTWMLLPCLCCDVLVCMVNGNGNGIGAAVQSRKFGGEDGSYS